MKSLPVNNDGTTLPFRPELCVDKPLCRCYYKKNEFYKKELYHMLFSSNIFLFLFLPVTLLGYYLLRPSVPLKNGFLLVMSLGFYAWGEPVYVFLMLASIAGNFLFGWLVGTAKGSKRLWLVLSVAFNLGILFWFKYTNFLLDNLNALLGTTLPRIAPALPIGISFFTFQAMSYVIDVYRGTAEIQKNPLYLALYISFFPQLIAGPIVRYNTIARQIKERQETLEAFEAGVCRFIQGLGKKVILSNVLALTSEKAFSQAVTQELTVLMAWLGGLAYMLQIYFDFSGYSDMAIGLGRMFGFQFEENFRYPYLSRSVSEFWRRWHISLGQWFRDYVYFPLGGSRVSSGKLLRNLFAVWLLTGIWHGANWTFILWGVLYGVLIAFEKFTGCPQKLTSPVLKGLYRLFTVLIVLFGFVLFGSADIGSAGYQLRVMLPCSGAPLYRSADLFQLSEYWPFYLLGIFAATPAWGRIMEKLPRNPAAQILRSAGYLLILLLSVSYLAMGAHNPFIYFNF